jgi:hypothetical protein
MHFLDTIKNPVNGKKRRIKWLIALISIFSIIIIGDLVYDNFDKIKHFFIRPVLISNFDEITYSDKFRRLTEPRGNFWILSYESEPDVVFSGLVGYTTPVQESDFAILTHDILVTNGDFSNPFIIEIKVADHRYRWVSWHVPEPSGSIALIHAIPINEKVNQKLKTIQSGDGVVIKGLDIFRIDSYDAHGNYQGFWKDDGCFTTLITEVTIYPGATSKSSTTNPPTE